MKVDADFVRVELGPVDDWIPFMEKVVGLWVKRNPYLRRDEAISEGFVILWQAYCDFDLGKSDVDRFPIFLRFRLNNRLHDFMRRHHCVSRVGDSGGRFREYVFELPSDGSILNVGSCSFEDDVLGVVDSDWVFGLLRERMDGRLFEALLASMERSGQKELALRWGLTEGAVSHIAKKAKSIARVILLEQNVY